MGVDVQHAARAKVVKAMAHPTRLFVVDELCRHGQRCVCQLADMIGADMSTVSRHLAVLKDAGILCDEKRGQQVFYRLKLGCVAGLLRCVDRVVQQAAENRLKVLRD